MRLGIMQPYFFPYLGYFSLIDATDRWIVFDTPQYIRRGWVNRNRILPKGSAEWKYISLPIRKCPREASISEVMVNDDVDWQDEIIRKLEYYVEIRAPFYQETVSFLRATFSTNETRLAPLLSEFLLRTCEHVGLDVQMELFSEMDLALGPVTHAGEWALRISEALGADTYINPSGGREIFDAKQFEALGIKILFSTPQLPAYDQKRPEFVSGLSIIDALMWNTTEQVRAMIEQYALEA